MHVILKEATKVGMALTLKKGNSPTSSFRMMYLVQPFDLWPNHRRLSPLIYSEGVNAETPVVGGEKC